MSLKIVKIALILAFSALIVKALLFLMDESPYFKTHYQGLLKPVVQYEPEEDSGLYNDGMQPPP